MNFHLLDCELVVTGTVRGELASENSEANLNLVEVCSSDLDEDVLGILGDLGSLTIDNGWEGEDLTLAVIEDGVVSLAFNDVKELLKLLIFLQVLEKLLSIHLNSLLKCLEDNILGCAGLVTHGESDLVSIMGSH